MKLTKCKKSITENSSPRRRRRSSRFLGRLDYSVVKSNIPCLSLDIIFNILRYVSPEFLLNVVRFVSKSWSVLISSTQFVNTNLSSRSSFSFIFHDIFYFPLDVSTLKQTTHPFFLKHRLHILDSVDGLILFTGYDFRLHLVNPITKQHLTLPPTGFSISSHAITAFIGRTPAGLIKIICSRYSHSSPTHSIVLTIASGTSSSWRTLEHPDDSHFVPFSSYSIGSMILYWAPSRLFIRQIYWGIDLDDESFHTFHFPVFKFYPVFMPMGRDLYAISRLFDPASSSPFLVYKLTDARRCQWVEAFRTHDIHPGLVKLDWSNYFAWFHNKSILIYATAVDGNVGSPSYMAYDFINRTNSNLTPATSNRLKRNIKSYIASLVSF